MTEEEWMVQQQCEQNLRSFQVQPKKRGPKPKEFEPWQIECAAKWAGRGEAA